MVSDDKCTETFVRATLEVLGDLFDKSFTPGPVQLIPSPVAILDVAVIVGLTGDCQGRVLFEFSAATALNVASVMNFGEIFVELTSMARATLSEFGNLVAGRAVTMLNDDGGVVHISPPILMAGLGMRSSDTSPVQRFTVATGSGDIGVNLSIRTLTNSNATLSHLSGRLNGVG